MAGHSQGGHAALFTASLAPAWAPSLDLTAAVALSPAGGAHDVIAGLADVPAPAPALGSLALVLLGAAAADRTLRLDRILTPAALRLLARAGTCGIDDLLAQGSPSLTAAGVFPPGADISPLLRVLAVNDPAALRLRAPALIVQGDDDPIVARSSTDRIARSLRASGAPVATTATPGGVTST